MGFKNIHLIRRRSLQKDTKKKQIDKANDLLKNRRSFALSKILKFSGFLGYADEKSHGTLNDQQDCKNP